MADRMTLDEALKGDIQSTFRDIFHGEAEVVVTKEWAQIGTFKVPAEPNVYETLKSLRRKLKDFTARYDM